MNKLHTPEQGYLYVATGPRHLTECFRSVQRLKQVTPQAHVTLVTDVAISQTLLDQVLCIPPEANAYLFKIAGIRQTPYRRTFFIDTDTWFCEPCEELFELLLYYDWCIAPCPNDHFDVYNAENSVLRGYYAYNTGVIVFRENEYTSALLNYWYAAYAARIRQYPHDQPALMEALLYAPVRLCVLQTIYNARTPYPTSFIEKRVKIIHGRHQNYEKIALRLNRHASLNRSWLPRWRCVVPYRRPWWFRMYMRLPEPKRQWIKSQYYRLQRLFSGFG